MLGFGFLNVEGFSTVEIPQCSGTVTAGCNGTHLGFASRIGIHSENNATELVAKLVFFHNADCAFFQNIGDAGAAADLGGSIRVVDRNRPGCGSITGIISRECGFNSCIRTKRNLILLGISFRISRADFGNFFSRRIIHCENCPGQCFTTGIFFINLNLTIFFLWRCVFPLGSVKHDALNIAARRGVKSHTSSVIPIFTGGYAVADGDFAVNLVCIGIGEAADGLGCTDHILAERADTV